MLQSVLFEVEPHFHAFLVQEHSAKKLMSTQCSNNDGIRVAYTVGLVLRAWIAAHRQLDWEGQKYSSSACAFKTRECDEYGY